MYAIRAFAFMKTLKKRKNGGKQNSEKRKAKGLFDETSD